MQVYTKITFTITIKCENDSVYYMHKISVVKLKLLNIYNKIMRRINILYTAE